MRKKISVVVISVIFIITATVLNVYAKEIQIENNQDKDKVLINPEKPSIEGPGTVKVLELATYKICSQPDQGYRYQIEVDWGDGNSWVSKWSSIAFCAFPSHMWTETGTYTMSVVARDRFGSESPTRTKTITVKKINSKEEIIDDYGIIFKLIQLFKIQIFENQLQSFLFKNF